MNHFTDAAAHRTHPSHTGSAAPTQPPTKPPTGSPTRRSRTPKLIVGGFALALLIGGATELTSTYLLDPESRFQNVAYAGENPFTAPVGTDRLGVTPVAARGEQPGDLGGMYAQDPETPACDGPSLVTQLQEEPTKARAWAQVLGITPGGIPAFVDSLTPVTLRANTAVIDYGYRDGTFRPTPAVLAAGTAVFINSYGEPTVKCFSGNPLTRGTTSDPNATVVTATPRQITTNVFTNVVTGTSISRPGKPDTKPNPGPNPSPPIDLVAVAEKARTAADGARVLATAAENQRVAAETAHATNTADVAARTSQLDLAKTVLQGFKDQLAALPPGHPDRAGLEAVIATHETIVAGIDTLLKNATEKAAQSQEEVDKAKAREENLKKDADEKEEAAKEAEEEAGIFEVGPLPADQLRTLAREDAPGTTPAGEELDPAKEAEAKLEAAKKAEEQAKLDATKKAEAALAEQDQAKLDATKKAEAELEAAKKAEEQAKLDAEAKKAGQTPAGGTEPGPSTGGETGTGEATTGGGETGGGETGGQSSGGETQGGES